jgi:hypothetical protein
MSNMLFVLMSRGRRGRDNMGNIIFVKISEGLNAVKIITNVDR